MSSFSALILNRHRIKRNASLSVIIASAAAGSLVIMVSTFVLSVVSVTASAFGSRDFDYYMTLFASDYRPYFTVSPIMAMALTYLLGIWKLRAHITHFKLLVLLTSGGVAIPGAITSLHFLNYSSHPEEYMIAPDKLGFMQAQALGKRKAMQDEVNRLAALERRFRQILEDPMALRQPIEYIDGRPSRQNCSRLDLGKYTGLICTRYFVIGQTDMGPVHRLEVKADADLKAQVTSLDLVDLLRAPKYYCSITRVMAGYIGGLKTTVERQPLLRCFYNGATAASERAKNLQEAIRRFSNLPPISLETIALETLAELVGADYDILQPLSLKAGAISVAGSLLVLAYFALFASFVIEGAIARLGPPGVQSDKRRRWTKRPSATARRSVRHR